MASSWASERPRRWKSSVFAGADGVPGDVDDFPGGADGVFAGANGVGGCVASNIVRLSNASTSGDGAGTGSEGA